MVYASPKKFYKPGSYRRIYDLVAVNLRTLRKQLIASNVLLNDVFTWSSKGHHLAYAVYGKDSSSYEMYEACPDDGTSRKIATLTHETNDGLWITPVWSPKGDFLYFILDGVLRRVPLEGGGGVESFPIANRTIQYVITQMEGVLWEAGGNKYSTIVLAHDEEGKEDGFYQLNLISGESTKLREAKECDACGWPVTDRNSYLNVASKDGKHCLRCSKRRSSTRNLAVECTSK